jgi:hypothetical protein
MQPRPVFDLKEREQVRSRLLAYKVRHGIGAPTIAKRIEEAAPGGAPIYHKTLSRFLARQHQPQDAFVARCAIFLHRNPEPVDDPDGDLAQAMICFCGVVPGPDFAGAYTLMPKPVTIAQSDAAANAHPAEVTIVADDGFWRITERPPGRHVILDGVLVNTAGPAVATLKDRLTGNVKTLLIWRQSETLLYACQTVVDNAYYASSRCRLERMP